MPLKVFYKTLMPFWFIEFSLTIMNFIFGSEKVSFFSFVLLVIAVVILPFAAGLCIVRAKGKLSIAALSGMSISFATLLAVGISYFVIEAGTRAFFGFIIASLMFIVIPQSFFGYLGGLFAKKYYVKA
jgi:hypothetical protein